MLAHFRSLNSAGIYLLKVNNRNTRTKCEIHSKLTIKTPKYVNADWEMHSDFFHFIKNLSI